MIKVGQKVAFDPFKDIKFNGALSFHETVEGVVHFVHPTHRWFNVEYGTEDIGRMLISFKFDDIGRTVKLVEG